MYVQLSLEILLFSVKKHTDKLLGRLPFGEL